MKYLLISLLILVSIIPCFAKTPKKLTANLLYKAEASTGEGSIWHPGRKSLFWVDIEGQTLYEYLPGKKDCRHWQFDRMISTVVPETDSTVVVSLQNEVVRVNLKDGKTTSIVSVPDDGGNLRCNDGKCDPQGRFWVGTMVLQGAPKTAVLYCVLPDGTITTKLKSISISNGIVWSADKKFMYYNDTPTGQVACFKYNDQTGKVNYKGIAVKIPDNTGGPDGMTIDAKGNLWVAQWGGFGVYCYNPKTGELLAKVDVPVPNVASCAFGGENLDELYITTARAHLSDEQLKQYPLSGSLFICKPGVKGVKANYFGDNKK